MTPVQLPEVPGAAGFLLFHHHMGVNQVHGYTAAQLREYATQAVMAERARMYPIREVIEKLRVIAGFGNQCDELVDQQANKLEALITPSETNSER